MFGTWNLLFSEIGQGQRNKLNHDPECDVEIWQYLRFFENFLHVGNQSLKEFAHEGDFVVDVVIALLYSRTLCLKMHMITLHEKIVEGSDQGFVEKLTLEHTVEENSQKLLYGLSMYLVWTHLGLVVFLLPLI